jgi:FAD:protein FMN transferase
MQTPRHPPAEGIRFRAMGSDAHVIVVGGPSGLAERARNRIDQLERRWSRFRPDSEVNVLTDRAGSRVVVSADTRLLVERAIEAWRLTGGAFDPTVLGAVLRSGYTRSFELGPITTYGSSPLLAGCTDITIDGREVCLPAGTGFDPGGIGKGLAADLVIADMLDAGAAGVCVNLGGDLRVAGDSPDGEAWTVAIEHPSSPEPVALLGLSAGAVATSTTLKRTWSIDGKAVHHLIDPDTGESAVTDLTLATVVAGEAWRAEVLAKAVLLRGRDRAFDVLDTNAEALVVDGFGLVTTTPGLVAFLGADAPPSHIDLTVAVVR